MSAAVDRLVGEIADLDLVALRELWRQRYGAAPSLRSVPLLRRLLAWRIQAEAYGGLDHTTTRALARKGPLRAEGLDLGIGACLTREWQGRTYKVEVEVDGYRSEGRLYPSLSAAATAIAGSRWNGPRFFGLRDQR
ncbi:DUF2924 domain-containing protein [Sphingomonas sp. TREG-RG-20F-R18-01]|uniref:DUF2924 domain-containing protein n=1 Tax=Sphingomonas sp. TREG-RG-20F-R18-01 TaxID=2914982 RepID=UPI001F561475|nr:DUF2924 domain-containing protein [Sphingomonas sp. TREG-RG-20F-R18-01]